MRSLLYIGYSTKNMQQNLENAYYYYAILLLGLTRLYSAFWVTIWTKIIVVLLIISSEKN